MIGTLDSGCARAELPALGRGGLLLVSPLNTADDLTAGRAAVARLSATDSAQAAAAARFMQRERARDASLRCPTERREATSSAPRSRARRRGSACVSSRGHADAAYVGGVLAGPTRKTLEAARRLAGDGPLALSSGYGPAAQLADTAGPAAEGAYLFVAGVPVERLGGPGARLRPPLRGVDRQVAAPVRGVRGAGGAAPARRRRGVRRLEEASRPRGAARA